MMVREVGVQDVQIVTHTLFLTQNAPNVAQYFLKKGY